MYEKWNSSFFIIIELKKKCENPEQSSLEITQLGDKLAEVYFVLPNYII